ncbi:MAG: 50S ribosomal protein L24 [Patescibacteria group bacterium]
MKIHKNDTVQIITGKDSGKTGKVLKVFPKRGSILIDGLNIYKKHAKPKKQGEKGQIVLVPRPINVSNIMIVCSACHKNTKVGYKLENKNKVRYCRKCSAKI